MMYSCPACGAYVDAASGHSCYGAPEPVVKPSAPNEAFFTTREDFETHRAREKAASDMLTAILKVISRHQESALKANFTMCGCWVCEDLRPAAEAAEAAGIRVQP